MGNLLYRKNFHIVQHLTDEIVQAEHIHFKLLMLNEIKNNSFVMQNKQRQTLINKILFAFFSTQQNKKSIKQIKRTKRMAK